MEAASAASGISGRLRAQRLERELERLRPLGEAFLLRQFAGKIGHADAEDAVAEVVARLHRAIAGGTVPENLRAMFFASARNAALDLLKARRRRPTAPLEAVAASAIDPRPHPSERAESREAAVRLQEMLARMRAKHGEALMLHYGLGMTVPQIAEHLGISRPAAKKRMLRAVREARERLAEIEGAEVCPQMRSLAWRSMFDKQASGLAGEAEAEALRAHFAHCGACRSFLASLRDALHDLGAAGVLGLAAGGGLVPQAGISAWAGAAAHGLEAGVEKARQLALRVAGPLSPGEGAAGALLGTGQKVAAVCGAASAATATCLLTGAVGPGLGVSAAPPQAERPAPQVRPAPAPAPPLEAAPESPQTMSEQPAPAPDPAPKPRPESAPDSVEEAAPVPATPAPPPPEPPPSEFGLEGGRSGSAASEPAAPAAPEAGGGEFGGGGTSGSEPGGSAASPGVGFQG